MNFEQSQGIAQARRSAVTVTAQQAARRAGCVVAMKAHLFQSEAFSANGALAVLLCPQKKSFVAVADFWRCLGLSAGLFFLSSAPERRFQAGFFFGRQERAAGRAQNPQLVRRARVGRVSESRERASGVAVETGFHLLQCGMGAVQPDNFLQKSGCKVNETLHLLCQVRFTVYWLDGGSSLSLMGQNNKSHS